MRNFLSNFLERLETRIYKFNGNGHGNGKHPVTELPKHELRFESTPIKTGININLPVKIHWIAP